MSSKEYQRDWHQRNKERRLLAIKAAKKERQGKLTEWLQELKEASPCLDCKVSYPYYVLHFDHVRGKKEINISAAITRDWTKPRIEKELAKCELVCANCHAIRTFARGQRYSSGSTPLDPTGVKCSVPDSE